MLITLKRMLFFEKTDFISKESNSYHPNIEFKYELEKNYKITFLDVLINRINFSEIETRNKSL